MDEFRHAVQVNDITHIFIKRSVPEVRLKPTVQAKLAVRPELTLMVDWCMEWIRTERAGKGSPGLDAMQQVWEAARAIYSTVTNTLFAKLSPS
jgi:hypothetical protein